MKKTMDNRLTVLVLSRKWRNIMRTEPLGSKDPNERALGPKDHSDYSI